MKILITGCSGGGKSTVLEELSRRGFACVAEPGRRLIAEGITPWDNPGQFLTAAARLAQADLDRFENHADPVFFDRGLIDAVAGLERIGRGSAMETLGPTRHYAREVFVAPPWPRIFRRDDGRRHSLADAKAEFDHLTDPLPRLGYSPINLPRMPVEARADFILARIR